MRLTAPTPITFWVSAALAVAAVAVKYFGINVPFVSENVFLGLLVAYVVLVLGNIVRGM
ncbi:MAG: hypothetical protein R3D33_09785 [Hyphomicrobiaceae bacterium]